MAERIAIHRPRRVAAPRYSPPGHSPAEKTHARQMDRALATNSAQWAKIRKLVLLANPLCVECQRLGLIVRVAVDVDHIDGDAHNNDLKNLQGLCRHHHSAKTAKEQGRKRKEKGSEY